MAELLGTSQSNTIDDPILGPWNMLRCRTNSLLILSPSQNNANGAVFGFDIYPYSSQVSLQALFAFRDSVNLAVSFLVAINSAGTLSGYSCNTTACTEKFATSASINWSKLIT